MFQIQFRRDISSQWNYVNPILALGEPGFEIDTGKIKVGNGSQRWSQLSYISGSASGGSDAEIAQAIAAHVNAPEPHPVYDDGPSLTLLYQNAKV